MESRLILETTFLIDLEREMREGVGGAARAFLERHEGSRLDTTFTVAGELASGTSAHRHSAWEELLRPFRILQSSPEVCWKYGEIYRYLAANGMLIGASDLWIAATALSNDLPVVTADEVHYRRVPGLRVVKYR